MKYKKKSKRCRGIDPGIANIGLAIVEFSGGRYQLLSARLVKTSPQTRETVRLLAIYNHVYGLLNEFPVTLVAIESVYHNKNVSSSIKTDKAIGAAICAAAQWEIPVIEFTPQQVKCSTGLGSTIDKDTAKLVASRLFGTSIKSHHEADAAWCALCGCLQGRTVVP